MRLISLLAIAIISALASGCNNEDRTELFELGQLMEFDVVAGLNTVDTHFFIQPNANSPYDDFLNSLAVEDMDVDAIEPKFCELTTIFEDIDLDFLRLIEVRVFDPFKPDLTREVFYLDPVPNRRMTTIRPFPGLSDVKEILSQPTYGIEVRLRFTSPPPTSMKMRLYMSFSAFSI